MTLLLVVAAQLGYAPPLRSSSPPDLTYEFSANVQLNLNAAARYAVSLSKPAVAIAIPPPLGSKSNHTELQFKCNDGVNQMDIDRFYDAHVCYNLSLQERAHLASPLQCVAYEMAQIMPLTGALLAACDNKPWCDTHKRGRSPHRGLS